VSNCTTSQFLKETVAKSVANSNVLSSFITDIFFKILGN